MGAELEAWLDTSRIGGGAVWTEEIERAIDGCDVALVILSPGSYRSDICRAEQLRALRKGKRVIPILGKAGTDVPLHLETKNYRDLSGGGQQTAQLKLLLQDIQAGKNGVLLRPEFQQCAAWVQLGLGSVRWMRPCAMAAISSSESKVFKGSSWRPLFRREVTT